MTTDTKTWMEVIEKSYQFYVYIFTLFVICMGVARWYGQTSSRKREETRRKQAGLPVAACFSNAEQGFTYTSLFQGGLSGVWVAGTQMAYVAVMLLWFEGVALWDGVSIKIAHDIWGPVSILMLFPVFMIAFAVTIGLFPLHKRVGIFVCILLICLSVVCIVASGIAAWKVDDKAIVVTIQLLAVAVLSLCMSYEFGIADGLGRADPEANYPLVRVEFHQGASLDKVWLYERTDSDYRFVSTDGLNQIIPAANVARITKI